MSNELSGSAGALLLEASRDPAGVLIRGPEDEPPRQVDSGPVLDPSAMLRRSTENLRRHGSVVSRAPIGYWTNRRFFSMYEWDRGFMELVMGEYLVPFGGTTTFKVSPKGYQAARELGRLPTA